MKRQARELAISTLARAVTLADRFQAGIYPTGAGQSAHFKALVKKGWLVFDDWGRDIDGKVDADVPIYQLTDAGRAAIESMRAAKEEDR